MSASVRCFLVERAAETWEHRTEHGVAQIHYWRNLETGELYRRMDDLPAGAMWNATWLAELEWHWRGPDGRVLMVKLPNGRVWTIDDRASNCGLPADNEHRCWVRHGEPPTITVDKAGLTCSAGAGSIAAGDYHGFLRAGLLESC